MQTEETFAVFADKVATEAQAIFDVVVNIPKSKVWKNGYPKKFDQPYSYYYRLHRLAEDFSNADSKIGKDATQVVKEVTKLRTDATYAMHLPYTLGANTFQESIGRDKQENSIAEKLQKFRFKLMGRRIAIALYNRKELKKNQIYNYDPFITSFLDLSQSNLFWNSYDYATMWYICRLFLFASDT